MPADMPSVKRNNNDVNRTYNGGDVIFNTEGKSSFSGCMKALKKEGTYLQAGHHPNT